MSAKNKGYKFAVNLVAMNDEDATMNVEEISNIISACLIADLFGVSIEKVAQDILKIRKDRV